MLTFKEVWLPHLLCVVTLAPLLLGGLESLGHSLTEMPQLFFFFFFLQVL